MSINFTACNKCDGNGIYTKCTPREYVRTYCSCKYGQSLKFYDGMFKFMQASKEVRADATQTD